MRSTLPILSAALLFSASAPAFAQPEAEGPPARPESTIFDGDYVTVAAGAALLPSYEGSDNYLITVAPLVRGSLGGVNFETRGPGLAADVVPDSDGPWSFQAGPAFRLNLNRTSRIKDPVVRALGKHDIAVEIGGFVGVSRSGLTSPYDSLSLRVDVLTDISGEHRGTTISPSIGFATPLSRAVFTFVSLDATHASGNYTASYFDVTPDGSAASGLPVFSADGGWKNWSARIGFNYDLDGDLTNGGLGLFAGGSYSRLLNDAARSPIVSIRGDRDQWFAAAGVTLTF